MTTSTSVLVLGCGRVGSVIAMDLAADSKFDVTVADYDQAALDRLKASASVSIQQADLTRTENVRGLLEGKQLAVGAVPGWLGYQTVRTVIEAGVNIVDISFFEQDSLELDELAREHGVTAVVDCGVAPGLSNLVLGRLEEEFDRLDRFHCLVGGLPQNPQPPWNYKAPYSPCDVIEMYTRPARLRRGGEEITLPALTENEPVDFPGVGMLEAFNTDGLRTILRTSKVPDLAEKTLRYPGNCEQIALLEASGFFSREPITVGDQQVTPLDVSSELLFKQWQQTPGEDDLTALRLIAEGERGGESVRLTYDLVDRSVDGISSMSRTTAYPCTAVARLVVDGGYTRPGVSPPEFVGREQAAYDAVMVDLRQRGVVFDVSTHS